jgi:RNA polymerase sigma-70 factor (ECF subfamily)
VQLVFPKALIFQKSLAVLNELELIERLKKGDDAAFKIIVEAWQDMVYNTSLGIVQNPEDAEDVAQEVFVQVYESVGQFKGDSKVSTWIYRIAVNKTINFLKSRKNKTHLSLNDLDFNAEHDPDLVALISDRTPRRDAGLAELQEKLNAAMQKLSPSHRLAVTLHDIQGLPHEDIARIMDCNVGTVRSRLFYARQQLQAYLSDYVK